MIDETTVKFVVLFSFLSIFSTLIAVAVVPISTTYNSVSGTVTNVSFDGLNHAVNVAIRSPDPFLIITWNAGDFSNRVCLPSDGIAVVCRLPILLFTCINSNNIGSILAIRIGDNVTIKTPVVHYFFFGMTTSNVHSCEVISR